MSNHPTAPPTSPSRDDKAKQPAPATAPASPTPDHDEERRRVNPGQTPAAPNPAHPQTGIVGREGPDAAADPGRTQR